MDNGTSTPDLLAHALGYAEKGLRVFPRWGIDSEGRCECRDPSCKSPGKHPASQLAPRGFQSATTDPATIREWWQQYPNANIGIRTGDGLLVLDLDVKRDANGIETLKKKLEEHGIELPPTLTVETPSGGRHLWFETNGHRFPKRDGLWPGVDLLAEGASIVAPPSRYAKTGKRYRFASGQDIASLPADLEALLPQRPEPSTQGQAASKPSQPVDVEKVQSALEQLDPAVPIDRDTGKRILNASGEQLFDWCIDVKNRLQQALHGSAPGLADEWWPEWCKRDPRYADESFDHEKHLRSFDPNRVGGVGETSLYWLAGKANPEWHYVRSDWCDEIDGVPPDQQSPGALGCTVTDVLGTWEAEGPLQHVSTGLKPLDRLTMGGPVLGHLWAIVGAPSAGKTLLMLHLAHHLAQNGTPVGVLAVDEEPSDLVIRLAQREGMHRKQCEKRHPPDLETLRKQLGALPITFYGSKASLDEATADFAKRCGGKPGAFLVDSIQTVRLRHESERSSTHEHIRGRVEHLKQFGARRRVWTCYTSEMNRSGYASRDASKKQSAMAAGSGSSSIEYGAKVILHLTRAGKHVQLLIPKNKSGRELVGQGEAIGLQPKLSTQTISVDTDFIPPPPEDATEARMKQKKESAEQTAGAICQAIAESPGIVSRDLRGRVAAIVGTSNAEKFEHAKGLLAGALHVLRGKGNRRHHHLDGSKVPMAIRARVEAEMQPRVEAARWPEDAESEGSNHG